MNRKRIGSGLLLIIVAAINSLLLFGCGGESGRPAPEGNKSPVANAGPDLNVVKGELVALSASSSSDADGNVLTYSWSITIKPADSLATLSSSTAVNPSFTADKDGSYTISLTVSDGTVSSPTDSLTVIAIPRVSLPDTGQIASYTTTTGEDNDYLVSAPSLTDNGNGTVTDNITGLTWQKHDDATARSWSNAVTYCSSTTLAGKTDWRLPTALELVTIADYGVINPAINTTYFPATLNDLYWSASEVFADNTQAWPVNFSFGSTSSSSKTTPHYVLCVRGQGPPILSYVDNGNGTITDRVTALIWQKQDDATARSWEQAITYCEGLTLGGQTDWRLPNIKELTSITDLSIYNPAVNETYFPVTRKEYYWSSTTYTNSSTNAWRVDFYVGAPGEHLKTGTAYVRCVR